MATKRKQARGSKRASGSKARSGRSGSASGSRARSASARRASSGGRGSTRSMDAIKLLKQDHREVEQLFDQFEASRSNRKQQIAEQICQMLTVHAQIEEEIFYPAARQALKEEDLVDEATVEHQSAKDLIAQIQGASGADDLFEAKVKVLGEYVRHHVKEEEGEMFKQLNSRKIDLVALGEQLLSRKQQLLGLADPGAAGASASVDSDDDTDEASYRGNGAGRSRAESPGLRARDSARRATRRT